MDVAARSADGLWGEPAASHASAIVRDRFGSEGQLNDRVLRPTEIYDSVEVLMALGLDLTEGKLAFNSLRNFFAGCVDGLVG